MRAGGVIWVDHTPNRYSDLSLMVAVAPGVPNGNAADPEVRGEVLDRGLAFGR